MMVMILAETSKATAAGLLQAACMSQMLSKTYTWDLQQHEQSLPRALPCRAVAFEGPGVPGLPRAWPKGLGPTEYRPNAMAPSLLFICLDLI